VEDKSPHRILEEIWKREQELAEREEELSSQHEELTAAVEQLIQKNDALECALKELKERNFELDQLLYRASHDLRSPIVSIMGLLPLIEHDPSKVMDYAPHMHTQADTMMRLVASLTRLADVGSRQPSPEQIYLSSLFNQCVDELSLEVRPLLPGDETFVVTDPEFLKHIVHPIVENAYRYGNPGQLPHIRWFEDPRKDQITIEITSEGEAMRTEITEKAFDMFFRGSERSTGQGLGLYIARKAAQKLSGTLNIIATNKSTTLQVVLPKFPYSKMAT
jgi:signal transduction histidine kinase